MQKWLLLYKVTLQKKKNTSHKKIFWHTFSLFGQLISCWNKAIVTECVQHVSIMQSDMLVTTLY